MAEAAKWRVCTTCRKDIGFNVVYWACSVSTCNAKRNPRYFCTVTCWDVHLAPANHRDPWAEEKRSPKA